MFKTIFLFCLIATFSLTLLAQEKMVIEGAIVVANNEDPNPTPGTIRWTGTNFEGYTGSQWVSLDFSMLNEGDGDSTNEIQDLSISGNILTITLNGAPTQIDLTPYLDNTDTQLSEAEVDNFVANNGYLITEQDSDVTNELQIFSVSSVGDTLFLSKGNFVIIPGLSAANAVQDIDGNIYTTVVIGSQEWMIENLKTTRYRDGSPIPLVTDDNVWANLTTPAYSWYDNQISHKDPYGALYNWYAVQTENLCPLGWHVPSDDEFKTLEMFLGMTQTEADRGGTWRGTDEGAKLKEAGTLHWFTGNTGTNTSGFYGLPSGRRDWPNGDFSSLTFGLGLWLYPGPIPTNAATRTFNWTERRIYRNTSTFPTYGNAVRCLRD